MNKFGKFYIVNVGLFFQRPLSHNEQMNELGLWRLGKTIDYHKIFLGYCKSRKHEDWKI